MKRFKELFGNLFTGGKAAGPGRPGLGGAGPAERPTPAPPKAQATAGRAQSAPEAAYEKGDVIGGKYEVHSMLGRGGFGEVYLAYSRETHEVYALKTFRQEFLADAEVKVGFKREALLWENLGRHPFILAARFVEELSGRLLVGMDYIAPDDLGRVSLADHLAHSRGPLGTDRTLEWAIEFCYGMEHANQHGIKCHRDIKPANILIRQDGTLLITDFGLAAPAEAAWRATGGTWEGGGEGGGSGLRLFESTGKGAAGTPGYMAPEVSRGEGADVRSDIYSFALVLWQMATGSRMPPFALAVAPPESPRDVNSYALEIYRRQMTERAPAVGEPLQGIIERCLEPEPSRRFASFTQLRAELEPILYRRTGRTVELPPVGEGSAAFWNNKGASLRALGRHDEAVTCLKKALEVQPDYAPAHYNLGFALYNKGDLEGAIAEYRTALRFQPDLGPAHNSLGAALDVKGDLDGAIAEYRRALRLRPDDAYAHNNLGLALYNKGDLEGALAEYRTALRFQPDLAPAHCNLGFALDVKGDLEEAIAEYRTAIRLEPGNAALHNNLARALGSKGDLDGAIAEYRTAIRLQPDFATAHYNLGGALKAKGEVRVALEEIQIAYMLAPNDPTIRQTYERLMRELKR